MTAAEPDNALRQLPAVQTVLSLSEVSALVDVHGRAVVTDWVREAIEVLRAEIRETDFPPGGAGGRGSCAMADDVVERVRERAARVSVAVLDHVVNATGVVLHTGLGRAPLSAAAREAVAAAATTANVELDLDSGERRSRGYQLLETWQRLTDCEDAFVVNNNAAATLLTLTALCAGREVVISRGQLIEIGGSYRLPDVFTASGAILREVGTTNRTRLSDYEAVIGENTAAILRVHPSNYRIEGFADTPTIEELVPLAHSHGLPCIDDIGSGCLVDTSRFGLSWEPTFQESLAAGADLVLGSGDKLLGGPQAGIVLGRREPIERLRRHPLARALRIDKLTLAALAATLDAYVRGTAHDDLPVLAMLGTPTDRLRQRAASIRDRIPRGQLVLDVCDEIATVGGGSLPGAELPTAVLAVTHPRVSADELARRLRTGRPRVVPRVRDDRVLIDLRSVLPEDDERIVAALEQLDR